MHSFPKFTRVTLWGGFTWVGTIIFGNFMKRGQFSVGQFSLGTIVRWPIFLGGNFPEGKYLGGNHPVGNYPGSNYPGRQFSSGAIVLETLRTIASDCSYQVSSFTLRKKTIQAEWRKKRVITKKKKKSQKRTLFNKINNASIEF